MRTPGTKSDVKARAQNLLYKNFHPKYCTEKVFYSRDLVVSGKFLEFSQRISFYHQRKLFQIKVKCLIVQISWQQNSTSAIFSVKIQRQIIIVKAGSKKYLRLLNDLHKTDFMRKKNL